MAGKINPVMPEAVTQAALRVMTNDQTVTLAAGLGQLELNHLLPLITHSLLESLTLLTAACRGLSKDCVEGIEARPQQCRNHVERSAALATVLVPALGYGAEELHRQGRRGQRPDRGRGDRGQGDRLQGGRQAAALAPEIVQTGLHAR